MARNTRTLLCLGLALLGLASAGCSVDDLKPRRIWRKLRRAKRKATAKPPPALQAARPQDDRPNVILVTMDTTRADALGSYGAPPDHTPHLDQLAAEGTVLTQSWSQAPSTSATHASLFTGARIYEHGVIGHTQRLAKSWTTLAEHFLAEGYATFALTSSARFRKGVRLNQGFRTYERYRDPRFADRSATAIRRLGEELVRHADRPSFGFVHLMDAHAPYDAPAPWGPRYRTGQPLFAPAKTVDLIRRWRFTPQKLGRAKVAQLRELYLGGVSHVDDHIRQIRALVEASTRPTLLVLTSDHGEAFGENGYLGHSAVLWEEVMRVPLLFWGPGIPAGQQREVPLTSADVMPTIASLAGVPLNHKVTGRDLAASVRTGAPAPHRDLVIQANHRWGVVRVTEDGIFKLIVDSATGEVMVVRSDDPDRRESAALVDDAALRESLLETVRGQDLSRPSQRSELRNDISEDELDQLRALGYIDHEPH